MLCIMAMVEQSPLFVGIVHDFNNFLTLNLSVVEQNVVGPFISIILILDLKISLYNLNFHKMKIQSQVGVFIPIKVLFYFKITLFY